MARADNSKNLVPMKKGHKPMGGRPKGSISLTTTLKKILDRSLTVPNPLTGKKEFETKTIREWLNLALIAKAMRGHVPALQMIYERIEGKVPQPLTGDLNVNLKELTNEQLQEIVDGK